VPRLPVDGKKVIEHRITFGTKERELLEDFFTSYRITSLVGEDGILNEIGSIDNVISKLAVIGFLLELFGIVDYFNFDDEGRAKALSILQKVSQMKEEGSTVGKAGKLTIDSLLEILSLGRIETDVFG